MPASCLLVAIPVSALIFEFTTASTTPGCYHGGSRLCLYAQQYHVGYHELIGALIARKLLTIVRVWYSATALLIFAALMGAIVGTFTWWFSIPVHLHALIGKPYWCKSLFLPAVQVTILLRCPRELLFLSCLLRLLLVWPTFIMKLVFEYLCWLAT